MPESIVKRIANVENLILAWRKVESYFRYGEVWFDEVEIAQFKFNLIQNIQRISSQLLNKSYTLQAIYPAPFPKSKDEDGTLRVRQSFLVSVADQVVWMAVVNIVGSNFERKMPAWSYGNRLHSPVWKENGKWKMGDMRNTTTLIYQKWSRSWPLYRRHIVATVKRMAFSQCTEEEEHDIQENQQISNAFGHLKLPYFDSSYFSTGKTGENLSLYWIGLDLTKFYQKVNMNRLGDRLCASYPDDEDFHYLIKRITGFHVDILNFTSSDLSDMQLDKPFQGLPTGLIVAGFLANVYLLEIDEKALSYLNQHRDVALFRYVDDHVLLGSSPQVLVQFVHEYTEMLKEIHLEVNEQKYEPEGVAELISENKTSNLAWEKAKLDPFYPSPLMTETLQKVSALSSIELCMLSDRELEMVFKDLQVLMVEDIPSQEIKPGTRISFACTMLSRMVSEDDFDWEHVYQLRKRWLQGLPAPTAVQSPEEATRIRAMQRMIFIQDPLEEITRLKRENESIYPSLEWQALLDLKEILKSGPQKTASKCEKIFFLLLKALHEMPDKSRIWLRTLDFCATHFGDNLLTFFHVLDELKQNEKLHKLGYAYLYAMLLIRVSHQMVFALHRLLNQDSAATCHLKREKKFLEAAMQIPLPEPDCYMLEHAVIIYCQTKLLYNAHQEKLGLKPFSDSKTYACSVAYGSQTLSPCFWILWGISLLTRNKPSEVVPIGTMFDCFFPEIRPDDPYFFPLITCCLNELSEANYRKLSFDKGKLYPLPAFVNRFEFFYTLFYTPQASFLGKIFQGYTSIHKNLNKHKATNHTIALPEWILSCCKKMESCPAFSQSVYASEYFAAKIELSIVEEVIKRSPDTRFKLHPFCFMLNQDEVLGNDKWQWWYQRKVAVHYKDERLYVDDGFYMYSQHFLDQDLTITQRFIYGLGMIFLQLIAKKVIMPWVVYRPEFGFEWTNVLDDLLHQGDISSFNYRIIRSCLSERNREILRLKRMGEWSDSSSESYDGRTFHGLSELKEALEQSIQMMEQYRVSVSNNQIRQLTVINLLNE